MFKKVVQKAALQKILKLLAFSGAGLLGLTLLLWVGGNAIAAKQEAEMDVIVDEYFQQYPDTEWNESARELKRLMAEVGFISITGKAESEEVSVVDSAKAEALFDVTAAMLAYTRAQAQKPQGPLDPIPEKVQVFVNENRAALTDIQNHLLTGELPMFPLAVTEMADFEYQMPSFMSLGRLQQLLLIKAVTDAQQNQPAEMTAALQASLVLNDVLAQRPETLNHFRSLIMMDQSMGIMRHLKGVPVELSAQLLTLDRQQIGAERLRFSNWLMYRSTQNWMKSSTFSEGFGGPVSAVISSTPFEKPYVSLANVHGTRQANAAYEQLTDKNICTAPLEDLSPQIGRTPVPWWNMLAQMSVGSWLPRWQEGGLQMLSAELTHHVVQAKALATAQGQWPETLPNLESQACPGEQWVYEVSPEGEMSLSFSREFDWFGKTPLDGAQPTMPLTYQSTLID